VALFALFDISGSTSAPAIRRRYFEQFAGKESTPKERTASDRSVLGQMKGGEMVMGDVITENTQATASFPINVSLPGRGVLDNPMVHVESLEKARAGVRSQAMQLLLAGKPAPHTDLMNAFQLAEKVLTGDECAAAKVKVLLIFSDMVEQSDRYNFCSEQLTPKRTNEIIAKERADGRLPDLKGVRAWVAGATAATSGGLSAGRIYQIQSFWLAYFKACGADLPKNHYAASLVNFRLSTSQ